MGSSRLFRGGSRGRPGPRRRIRPLGARARRRSASAAVARRVEEGYRLRTAVILIAISIIPIVVFVWNSFQEKQG